MTVGRGSESHYPPCRSVCHRTRAARLAPNLSMNSAASIRAAESNGPDARRREQAPGPPPFDLVEGCSDTFNSGNDVRTILIL